MISVFLSEDGLSTSEQGTPLTHSVKPHSEALHPHYEAIPHSVRPPNEASRGKVPSMDGALTTGQVAQRLGVKPGMVRRYALTLEAVTGITLELDPLRGRLYPVQVVELLEATRAHLLNNSGLSVEAAMRAVTGTSEEEVTPPSRVTGTLTPDDLREALRAIMEPVAAELQAQRRESEALRHQLGTLLSEVEAMRGQLARLEVTTHAALPSMTSKNPSERGGTFVGLARLFRR
jgi:DNA-binding transcriptional MerR regulator